MNPLPDQDDISMAHGPLRDSTAEEKQRTCNEVAKAMRGGDHGNQNRKFS